MDQHPNGRRVEVTHACPECPLGAPRPLCRTCHGFGTLTTEDLERWQARHLAEEDGVAALFSRPALLLPGRP